MGSLLKRRLFPLIASLNILFLSLATAFLAVPARNIDAAAGVGNILGYVLSMTGAVDTLSGGTVRGVTSSVKDKVREAIADQLGTGIYQDSNGNYIFSGEATQAIYDALNSGQDYNVRVVSNYGGGLYYINNVRNVNYEFLNCVSNYKSQIQDYFALCYQYKSYTYFYIYDISKVSYILVSGKGSSSFVPYFRFYKKSGSSVYCNCYCCQCEYDSSSYSFNFKDSSLIGSSAYCNIMNSNVCSSFFQEIDSSFPSSVDETYNNFPFTASGGSLFMSNKSIVLGVESEASAANFYVNSTSGVFVSNTYNEFPSVSGDTINNTNWENVYNNYVTNVTNNYYEEVGEGSDLDLDKLQAWMKRYSGVITDAVEEGASDIEETIDVSNDWLRRIYQRIGDIEDALSNMGLGSGSSSDLSLLEEEVGDIQSDIAQMKTVLEHLGDDMDTSLSRLLAIYVKLDDIYKKMGSSGGGGGGSNIPDWIDDISELTDVDISDLISDSAILLALLGDLVPFCFISAGAAFFSSLAVEPVDPVFAIPLKYEAVGIDETFTIDFTVLNDLMPTVRAIICILFIIFLMRMSFVLAKYMVDLFT